MSDVLRIGIIAEGFTDGIVIRAAIEAMLAGRPFVTVPLHPEGSYAFQPTGDVGPLGGGWKGVYKWCRQTAARAGGRLRDDILLEQVDILIVHLDADVASKTDIAEFPELAGQLPCELPCPPASATVDRLRLVLLGWLGETDLPPATVLCIPSKSTEAWVMTALYPADPAMKKLGPECHRDPVSRLGLQKLASRIRKSQEDYQRQAAEFAAAWPRLVTSLSEAARFQNDFQSAPS